jgi:hypothetical protein
MKELEESLLILFYEKQKVEFIIITVSRDVLKFPILLLKS